MDINVKIKFYHLLMHHLPVGFDENFQMLYILNKLRSTDVTILDLWNHFNSLYNLDELRALHMNLNLKVIDFDLPSSFDEIKRFTFPRTSKTCELNMDVTNLVKKEKFTSKPKKVVEPTNTERDVFDFDEDDHTDDEFAVKKVTRPKSSQKTKNKYR